MSAGRRAGSKPFARLFARRRTTRRHSLFCAPNARNRVLNGALPRPNAIARDVTGCAYGRNGTIMSRFARVRFFFSASLAARRASARATRDARARFARQSRAQEDRRLPRRRSRLAERARVLARCVVDAHAVQHPRPNRVVTRERDRSPAGAMRASSRSPARLAETRARGARLLAIALCASLPFAALAQTMDAHELNLCGSGTPPPFSSRASALSRFRVCEPSFFFD